MRESWINLIHNAIQAMKGKGKLEISVVSLRPSVPSSQNPAPDSQRPVPGPQSVMVGITDSGHGIPDEIKEHIFEPFFTTKAADEGSGLGLDICRRIIEKHQGSIDISSQPGKTTFRVVLPLPSGQPARTEMETHSQYLRRELKYA